MTFDQFTKKAYADFKKRPHAFWAKKFDTVVHVPAKAGYGVMCNAWAARLGNNYAPIYGHKMLCPDCLRASYESLKQI